MARVITGREHAHIRNETKFLILERSKRFISLVVRCFAAHEPDPLTSQLDQLIADPLGMANGRAEDNDSLSIGR